MNGQIKSHSRRKHLHTVVHAFVILRLDISNSLLAGVSASTIASLQLAQNAAAHLLTGTRRRRHIMPVLKELHWLPVSYRIKFKIVMFIFKALNGLVPNYLSNLISLYVPSRSLQSVDMILLIIPVTRCHRAFSAVAPSPVELSSFVGHEVGLSVDI